MSDQAEGPRGHPAYPPPVERLLAFGEADARRPWPDYPAEIGLTLEHVPALIRLAADAERLRGLPEPAPSASIHAWRALGQLRAAAAVSPLLELLIEQEQWDWASEGIPRVLGMIGRAALGPAANLLYDEHASASTRAAAGSTLVAIAKNHPELRGEVVDALVTQLEDYGDTDAELNGLVVADLMDLHAVEAAPVMERAFGAEAVDISIAGDWEDVQVELGLLEARRTPRPQYHAGFLSRLRARLEPQNPAGTKKQAKARSRRKAARASRRKNRRR